MIEPIRDHWVIALGIVILVAAVVESLLLADLWRAWMTVEIERLGAPPSAVLGRAGLRPDPGGRRVLLPAGRSRDRV
jgi:hypothetical protein